MRTKTFQHRHIQMYTHVCMNVLFVCLHVRIETLTPPHPSLPTPHDVAPPYLHVTLTQTFNHTSYANIYTHINICIFCVHTLVQRDTSAYIHSMTWHHLPCKSLVHTIICLCLELYAQRESRKAGGCAQKSARWSYVTQNFSKATSTVVICSQWSSTLTFQKFNWLTARLKSEFQKQTFQMRLWNVPVRTSHNFYIHENVTSVHF